MNSKIFEQVGIFNSNVIHYDWRERGKVNGSYIGRAAYHLHFCLEKSKSIRKCILRLSMASLMSSSTPSNAVCVPFCNKLGKE